MIKQSMIKAINAALSKLQSNGIIPDNLTFNVQIESTHDEQKGHFTSNIAFLLAKRIGMTPYHLAIKIIDFLPVSNKIARVEAAKPGFINFYLSDDVFYDAIKEALSRGRLFGHSNQKSGEKVHIEFVSANPTGPLHVGHGRSAAYGACVANLLEAVGYTVHREYYVNDAGRQMHILALSTWLRYLQLLKERITLPLKAYQGKYIIDVAKQLVKQYGSQYQISHAQIQKALAQKNILVTDEERYVDALVEEMQSCIGEQAFDLFRRVTLETILCDIRQDLEAFGVTYHNWFRESDLHKKIDQAPPDVIAMTKQSVSKNFCESDFLKNVSSIERFKNSLLFTSLLRLKAQGHLFEKEGALWFRATDYGDEKDRVLLRADGRPTYFASDVAYHLYKYQQGYDEVIDIFGADHHGFIQRLRAFLKGLKEDTDKLTVLLVQFAVLYRGKEKVSMSTRTGEFVTLRQLRQEVGNDAARYFYIMRKPEQHLDFDLELAKLSSHENPVYYIQYAYARICSLWKRLEKEKIVWNKHQGVKYLLNLSESVERSIMYRIFQYTEVVQSAAFCKAPHRLAHFLEEMAGLFHRYYNAHRFIIHDVKQRHAKLCLIAAVQQVIGNGLDLLGVSKPEKM